MCPQNRQESGWKSKQLQSFQTQARAGPRDCGGGGPFLLLTEIISKGPPRHCRLLLVPTERWPLKYPLGPPRSSSNPILSRGLLRRLDSVLGCLPGPCPLQQASSRIGADITPQSPLGHPQIQQEVWEVESVPCPHHPSSLEKVGAADSVGRSGALQSSAHLQSEATWLLPSP